MDEGVSYRTAAGIGAACVALIGTFGFFGVLWGLALTERPNPSLPDGDPCCTHPDTWDEVWDGVTDLLVFTVVDGLFFAVAAGLGVYASTGRRPRWRWLALIPLGFVTVTGALVALALG